MIRLGQGILALGIAAMLLPLGANVSLMGFLLIGLGCAPIYPCVIHATPAYFGAENSQAIIGVQMASAYLGTCLAPPVFGLIAQNVSIRLFPFFLLAALIMMFLSHEALLRKTRKAVK